MTSRPKREPGQGTIRTLASGKLHSQVMVGRHPETGRPVRVSITASTQRELRDARDKARAAFAAGQLPEQRAAGRQTIASYLTTWLADKRLSVEWATYRTYESHVRNHLIPALGGHRLDALRAAHIRAAYRSRLTVAGAPTVRAAHVILRMALKRAVVDGILVRNPSDGVVPPRVPRTEIHALTDEQVAAFLAACDFTDRARWTLAASTGMRLGELLALKLGDFTFTRDGGTVTIQRAIESGEGGVTRLKSGPKSSNSLRTLRLDAGVCEVLFSHFDWLALRRQRAHVWGDPSLAFPAPGGVLFSESNVTKQFKRRAKEAGLPLTLHPHLLRHTVASRLLAEGRPLPEVAYILGHSMTTLNTVYAHWIPRGGQAPAALPVSAFSGTHTTPASPDRSGVSNRVSNAELTKAAASG